MPDIVGACLIRQADLGQVWLGAGIGLAVCMILGAGFVGVFLSIGVDRWSDSEYIWEGVLGIVASIIMTIMGKSMLRLSMTRGKWQAKFDDRLTRGAGGQKASDSKGWSRWYQQYEFLVLPFVTILREGIEGIMFVAGVSVGSSAMSIFLGAVTGMAAGCLVGYLIYQGAATTSLKLFLTVTTCFLYHVAAGLFSRAIWFFEADNWNKVTGGDAAESGSGPGSYDIRRSVWHVNCCNPELNGGGWWGVFNSLLGWQNSATYGSVISYNLYWYAVMLGLFWLRYKEVKVR